MKNHYHTMFAYNQWANRLFLDCLSNNTVANAKVFLLMSHLLTAEEIWLCRLTGEAAPNERLWEEYALPELGAKAQKNAEAWNSWLSELNEQVLIKDISYRNTKGVEFTTAVADILNHVVNHGTYHRAQIASLLRLEMVDPPVSDYIQYVRVQE